VPSDTNQPNVGTLRTIFCRQRGRPTAEAELGGSHRRLDQTVRQTVAIDLDRRVRRSSTNAPTSSSAVPAALQPADVDNEPVRKAHPYIHACINAGRNGAFAVAQRVIEEDLIVTNVNPDRRQT
jgi:hypothetical protein